MRSYAKVNLHLDVLRKLPDGTHELLTVFERVDLADELSVSLAPGPGIRLTCSDPALPVDSTNLVIRAAQAFQELSGWTAGLKIDLRKKIPMGGGLGGGSSNAAATLLALQRLSGGALSKESLVSCARRLGADVAFFLEESPFGLGRGRGDQIEPIAVPGRWEHVLVTPEFPIPTKEVYRNFQITAPPRDPAPLLNALQKGAVSSVRDALYNALEPVVERLYPAIRQVKSAMESAGLKRPMVSGSGSTVFALCDTEGEATRAAEKLQKKYPAWRIFSTSTM